MTRKNATSSYVGGSGGRLGVAGGRWWGGGGERGVVREEVWRRDGGFPWRRGMHDSELREGFF